MKGWRAFALLLTFALMAPIQGASQGELAVDLSHHAVALTTNFAGTQLLLFGAAQGPGEIIVVVKGPPYRETVRRKGEIGGVWINRAEVSFAQVPAFYAIASSSVLRFILPDEARKADEIGHRFLALEPDSEVPADEARTFREALIRLKERNGLYVSEVIPVNFLGNRLFRTTIPFPSSAPVGAYEVKVILVRDQTIIESTTTPLLFRRIGFGAKVYDLAYHESFVYGVLAVLIAVMAGWIASVVFRKA